MNRKKTAALIGASTFTLLVGCGVPDTPSPSASQGQEARDGKLGFTVRDVSQVDSVGDPYDPFAYQKAKGVFEVIRLTVRNVGNESQSFDAFAQKLVINGKQFDYNSDASGNVDTKVSHSVSHNPSLQSDAVMVFDVPSGSPLGVLEVHDSMFSSGATIDLVGAIVDPALS
ncbi:MAG: hypothetical protein QOH54_3360 [Mycobacterium sp.]|jgi:hypothetical protein|nr:hypothetical protein [Mycobacterium sp.]MDT5361199.1 hypothetical protein [Mycobacterium sp.]